jgi:hypothetical protein
MINCCWGVSCGYFESLGNDHPMSFSTKAYSVAFSTAHSSKACKGASEFGEQHERGYLAS